jgi:hypothetical protein
LQAITTDGIILSIIQLTTLFANIFCDKARGEDMLSEVRIYLKKQLPKNWVMDGSFALPDNYERGNCRINYLSIKPA